MNQPRGTTGALLRAVLVVLTAALAAALLTGCGLTRPDAAPVRTTPADPSAFATPSGTASPTATQRATQTATQTATAPAAPVIHRPVVLAISVDGLNPDALTELGADGAPAFHRLMEEGSYTLDARTAVELTETLPNHTGMMTGRTIGGDEGSSVRFNADNGSTLEAVHGSYVPGIFDVAHDHGLRTALFAEKDKFDFLVRSWDSGHGAADVTGEDDGSDKIDTADIAPASELVPEVIDALTHDTRLVFWHIAAPDAAGHADGWMGSSYLSAVSDADDEIGTVLDAIDAHPRLKRRLTIVLTADHGGTPGERSHADATKLTDYRIPFVVWGRDVRRGGDLYDLNPRREPPGTGRPGYAGPQPIRNIDVAEVALGLLRLPVPEDTWAAAQVPLRLR